MGDHIGVVALASGFVFVDDRDESVGAALRKDGEWEPHIATVMQRILRHGNIAVEVGSNIGAHVLTFSRNVGDPGKVFAIEGNPYVADLLRATVAINHLNNVTVIQEAVLDKPGRVEIWALPANLGGGAVALPGWRDDPNLSSWQRHSVEATTLDVLFSDTPSVDLIHIDAEGCELAILAGAKSLLSRSPNVSIIAEWGAHHAPSYFPIKEGLEMLFAHGFKASRIERDGTLTPQSQNDLMALQFCDILFSRER